VIIMYLFPAIDLREGAVVRLRQGDYARQTTYHDDPIAQARDFEAAGARWLHVVDLDGARAGRLEHRGTIEAICRETDLWVEAGGGIRSRETIDQLLAAGVRRVVLGTAALEHWDWFRQLVEKSDYADRLVLGLDTREGKLAVAGWERTTETPALAIARQVSDWPLAAIIYTDIATDGTLSGPNVPALAEMTEATAVPIVASGGVGRLADLKKLRDLPLQGVIVGRALYDGAFTAEEAVRTLQAAPDTT
jgi:phosphoribosylformimino-5-aminoimidazole carboxamide ribotide isomerase